MTHDVLIYVKQTKRIYGAVMHLRPEDARKLFDAMGARLTRWQRFKCWLGLDAFPDGRVDARVWLHPSIREDSRESWTLHDQIDGNRATQRGRGRLQGRAEMTRQPDHHIHMRHERGGRHLAVDQRPGAGASGKLRRGNVDPCTDRENFTTCQTAFQSGQCRESKQTEQ